jgi:hypothetical protein
MPVQEVVSAHKVYKVRVVLLVLPVRKVLPVLRM